MADRADAQARVGVIETSAHAAPGMKYATPIRLRHALIAAAAIFALLVFADKLGTTFRPLGWSSAASWREVGENAAGYLAMSILAGVLFSFFGKDPE